MPEKEKRSLDVLRMVPMVCVLLVVGILPVMLDADESPVSGKAAEKESASTLMYMGNQACKECHPTAYKRWVGTKHARAYVILAWSVSREMVGEGTTPEQNRTCLRCHATATRVGPERRAPGFHIEEGVKCEGCHGPGEAHVIEERARKEEAAVSTDRSARMEKLEKETCGECHRPLASHEMLGTPPFDYEKSWPVIEHSNEKETPSDRPTEQ